MAQYPETEEGRYRKARANRAMFDGVARRYDLLNRLMSLGMDRGWRRRLVRECAVTPGDRCLDLCCGTGDVTRELARYGARAVGVDASAEMLAVAQQRDISPVPHGMPHGAAVGYRDSSYGAPHGDTVGYGAPVYLRGDALALPFTDGRFAAVTVAFGNRNVASLMRLYAEMRRVAAPGGRVATLEITAPRGKLARALFLGVFTRMPGLLARLVGADAAAYQYLPESVRVYPDAESVAGIMRDVGLREVRIIRLMGGVVVIHVGVR